MARKSPSNLNANTAFSAFALLYAKETGKEYEVQTFIGREISALKKAIDTHGYFNVLAALYDSLKQNGEKARVMFTLSALSYYLPDCKRPDLYWKVLTSTKPSDKVLWRELVRIETKWFPKASDKARYKELVMLLEGNKNGKSKAKTDKLF
jgi:hypothetical protein